MVLIDVEAPNVDATEEVALGAGNCCVDDAGGVGFVSRGCKFNTCIA
jgi:hypothetical protein